MGVLSLSRIRKILNTMKQGRLIKPLIHNYIINLHDVFKHPRFVSHCFYTTINDTRRKITPSEIREMNYNTLSIIPFYSIPPWIVYPKKIMSSHETSCQLDLIWSEISNIFNQQAHKQDNRTLSYIHNSLTTHLYGMLPLNSSWFKRCILWSKDNYDRISSCIVTWRYQFLEYLEICKKYITLNMVWAF